MKAFQQPLSSEEEIYYLRNMQSDDAKLRKEAKETLIERNLRLVAHIVKKYQNASEDMEDLLSIGTIGLIKAVDSFDASKGSKLATYAARCIENELLMRLRAKKKTLREVSLYEPIGTDKEGNEISLLDVVEQDQVDIVEQMELAHHIQRLHNMLSTTLTERELEIITKRYGLITGEEVTQREIGRELGISRSYVSRLEKKALQKLRLQFEKDS
ncbi:MAG: RNA polymerase sporulation sigma factor SigK [Eubacteriales bacterium]